MASGRRRRLPDRERSQTQKSMMRGFQQVPSWSEEILDDTVEREETLRLTSRFKSAHLPFSFARRLMRDFGAIVGISFGAVGKRRSQRRNGLNDLGLNSFYLPFRPNAR